MNLYDKLIVLIGEWMGGPESEEQVSEAVDYVALL
jgi:hypothetical protein